MGNSCSPGCRWWFDCVFLCCPFFPLDVLGEIWDLIESVSEGFLTYSIKFQRDMLFFVILFRFLYLPQITTFIEFVLNFIITLMCLSIGTPKNNKFSICSKWKIYYF